MWIKAGGCQKVKNSKDTKLEGSERYNIQLKSASVERVYWHLLENKTAYWYIQGDLYPSFSSHFSWKWHLPGDMQLNPQNKYRNARKQELEHMCKPGMHCALVAQRTCMRLTREHWEQKQAFLRILWAFQGCYTLFTWTFVFTGFHLL